METNYIANEDLEIVPKRLGVMDHYPVQFLEIEDLFIKAKKENDTEAMKKATLMYTLLSVKSILKGVPNDIKIYDIENDIGLKHSILYTDIIFPIRQSLLEEGYTIDENTTFNTNEAIKYIDRVLNKGEYTNTPQGKRHKLLAFKRMFNLTDKKYLKEDAISLNKEVINNDFSVRHDLILEAMGHYGDKENPFKVSNRNIEVTKMGVKCDIHDKILFDFLLGQFVENGGTRTKLVLRSDLLNALHFNGKGDRFEYIKKSLGAIASQTIFIDDEENKDKATKQISKSISKEGRKYLKSNGANLFQFEYIEVEGEMAIIFNIPLMKNFCSHKQFGRNISSDIMKHWIKNPRIYLIARELSSIERNKHTNTIKVETLLKNTECWEEYKTYSNKRVYLQRFIKDIEASKKYLLTGTVEYEKFSPSTLKDATIKVKQK